MPQVKIKGRGGGGRKKIMKIKDRRQDNIVDDDFRFNYYYTYYDQVRSILLNCNWVIVIGKNFNEEGQMSASFLVNDLVKLLD